MIWSNIVVFEYNTKGMIFCAHFTFIFLQFHSLIDLVLAIIYVHSVLQLLDSKDISY